MSNHSLVLEALPSYFWQWPKWRQWTKQPFPLPATGRVLTGSQRKQSAFTTATALPFSCSKMLKIPAHLMSLQCLACQQSFCLMFWELKFLYFAGLYQIPLQNEFPVRPSPSTSCPTVFNFWPWLLCEMQSNLSTLTQTHFQAYEHFSLFLLMLFTL